MLLEGREIVLKELPKEKLMPESETIINEESPYVDLKTKKSKKDKKDKKNSKSKSKKKSKKDKKDKKLLN